MKEFVDAFCRARFSVLDHRQRWSTGLSSTLLKDLNGVHYFF